MLADVLSLNLELKILGNIENKWILQSKCHQIDGFFSYYFKHIFFISKINLSLNCKFH